MNLLQAFILGVVEGLTEFLPVSSTGHLILVSSLLKIPETNFIKSFEVAIQLGAIASVIFLYWRSFLNPAILKKLAVGFLPTGVIGLIFYRIVKTYLLGNEASVLFAMLLGGIALIIFEKWRNARTTGAENAVSQVSVISGISYKNSFIVGIAQAVAVIPGISRSAATIVGGLLLGIERKTIVEFSFLLAVPTMLAATGFDLVKNGADFSGADFSALVFGFVVAFTVAIGSVKFLLKFIQTRTFIPFGVYRILIAIVFFLTIA